MKVTYACLSCGAPVTEATVTDAAILSARVEVTHDGPQDEACRWFAETLAQERERALLGVLARASQQW